MTRKHFWPFGVALLVVGLVLATPGEPGPGGIVILLALLLLLPASPWLRRKYVAARRRWPGPFRWIEDRRVVARRERLRRAAEARTGSPAMAGAGAGPRVLVPLDGSPLSEALLPSLRSWLGSPSLVLLRATEDAAGRAAAEAELERLAGRLRAAGLEDVATVVREGSAPARILDAAAELEPALIAMTTHGRTGLDRLMAGSVAESVLRASPVPVLALHVASEAPAAPADLFERVLLPYDALDGAMDALDALARLDRARRSSVLLFTVLEPLDLRPDLLPGTAAMSRRLEDEDNALRLAEARARGEVALRRARDLGFGAGIETALGAAAPAIAARALSLPASLVVMRTHGRSGLARVALGSVTERVLRTLALPVLVCPPPTGAPADRPARAGEGGAP
ncbi:MAG TPA: universal stress protein [Planctomycetota bacterium]|nr:universal stress protein [Planctomycetota bacterium]